MIEWRLAVMRTSAFVNWIGPSLVELSDMKAWPRPGMRRCRTLLPYHGLQALREKAMVLSSEKRVTRTRFFCSNAKRRLFTCETAQVLHMRDVYCIFAIQNTRDSSESRH